METNWNKYFFDFIKKHNDKPWCLFELRRNPNIT